VVRNDRPLDLEESPAQFSPPSTAAKVVVSQHRLKRTTPPVLGHSLHV